jgi:hypothetical protein
MDERCRSRDGFCLFCAVLLAPYADLYRRVSIPIDTSSLGPVDLQDTCSYHRVRREPVQSLVEFHVFVVSEKTFRLVMVSITSRTHRPL